MEQRELQEFEGLCQCALNPQSPKFKEAREVLDKLGTDITFIDKLKVFLELTTQAPAQYFAALCIKSLFSAHWNKFDVKVKADFKEYLMSYLTNKAATTTLDTLKAVVQCLILLIKLGWFDDPTFQRIIPALQDFATFSYNHQMVTFIAFDLLIQEMSYFNKGRSLSQNRRVSMHFKDTFLGDILTYSLKSSSSLLTQLSCLPPDQHQAMLGLLLQCLKVINGCFNFDFAGRFDDTLENVAFNQMPITWSTVLMNDTLLQPIFDVIFNLRSEEHQVLALKIVAELCNCRYTFFREDEQRRSYYAWLLPKLIHAMEVFSGSKGPYRECLIAFSKYVGNFRLTDLESIGLAQGLVIMWDFFSQCGVKRKRDFMNNAELLLVSWIRLLKEAMYSPVKEISGKLEGSVKEFLNKFINKCLKIVSESEDTYESFAATEMKGSNSIFDLIAAMSLFCYDITVDLVHEKVHICTEAYREEVHKKPTILRKLEDRLGWLIQLVASMLKAKAASPKGFATSDQKEVEIYATTLKLMDFTTSLYRQNYFASQNLEYAYLAFCEGFRKEVIANPKGVTADGDSEFGTSSDTYSILEQALQVTSFNQIIDMLLQKMIINLQMHTGKNEMVQLTLQYMKQVVTDSSRIKKVNELPSIRALLENPAGIVNLSKDASQLKHQALYYEIITILVTSKDIHTQFFPFLSQFDLPFQSLLSKVDPSQITPRWKLDVQNLFYILIGILHALHSSVNFSYFFEWFYPENMKLIQQTLRLYPGDLEIHRALLKFLRELTNNSSHRLRLDSINGFIIFKECCPIIADLLQIQVNYAASLGDPSALSLYPEKAALCYKLLKNTLEVITNTMTGNYVHFGVLDLYEDNCFILLSKMVFDRIFALNMEELAKYKSAEKAMYHYIQEFFKHHCELAFINYDTKTLLGILALVKLGLTTESSDVITLCCNAVEEVTMFIVRERFKSKPKLAVQQSVTQLLRDGLGLFLEITEILLKMACYEDGEYMHSVANPVFSLTLLNKELFDRAKEPVLAAEKLESARVRLFEELQKLFEGVGFTLDSADRSKFTSNFFKFRTNIKGII